MIIIYLLAVRPFLKQKWDFYFRNQNRCITVMLEEYSLGKIVLLYKSDILWIGTLSRLKIMI